LARAAQTCSLVFIGNHFNTFASLPRSESLPKIPSFAFKTILSTIRVSAWRQANAYELWAACGYIRCAHEDGRRSASSAPGVYPDLHAVIAAWPALAESVRARMLRLVGTGEVG